MNQVQNLSQYGMWSYTAMKHQAAVASADGRVSSGAMGTSTGPQRQYTCSFCGRKFRSAQALGGHMNVHRRDRAHRLCQSQQGPAVEPASPASMSSEFVAGAAGGSGSGLFYPTLPNQDGSVFPPRALMDSPSNILSMSPAVNIPTVTAGSDDSSSNATGDGGLDEELDLELRLWWP